jgi:hypothetical protein
MLVSFIAYDKRDTSIEEPSQIKDVLGWENTRQRLSL